MMVPQDGPAAAWAMAVLGEREVEGGSCRGRRRRRAGCARRRPASASARRAARWRDAMAHQQAESAAVACGEREAARRGERRARLRHFGDDRRDAAAEKRLLHRPQRVDRCAAHAPAHAVADTESSRGRCHKAGRSRRRRTASRSTAPAGVRHVRAWQASPSAKPKAAPRWSGLAGAISWVAPSARPPPSAGRAGDSPTAARVHPRGRLRAFDRGDLAFERAQAIRGPAVCGPAVRGRRGSHGDLRWVYVHGLFLLIPWNRKRVKPGKYV